MSTPNFLRLDVLTAEAFAPYGDVIEANASGAHFTINAGFAQRFHNLATVDVARAGGTPIMSIVRAKPRQFPLRLQLLERHPLGSQAFVALAATPFMVVVAPPANQPQMEHLRCFWAAPGQGVNYAPGTWHHPLIALHASADFLVVDRGGAAGDANCDEFSLADHNLWVAQSSLSASTP
jgi:ureidoglycolate lyase